MCLFIKYLISVTFLLLSHCGESVLFITCLQTSTPGLPAHFNRVIITVHTFLMAHCTPSQPLGFGLTLNEGTVKVI